MRVKLRYPLSVILIGLGLSFLLKPESEKPINNVVEGKVIDAKKAPKLSKKEIDCLKKNVFYEAGVEPIEGKIAVAQVTLNRVMHSRFGDDVCEVVYAPKQFSWTLKKNIEKPTGPLWEETKIAVERFLNGERIQELESALFYHTDYIKNPKWADVKFKITKIGRHIFYHNDRKA